ncbi:MAG: glycerol kinase GlpK [Gammaproteobacteria bacterium]
MSYFLALDQGTSSSRAMLFDARGNPVARAQQEFAQSFPRPGWIEQDAVDVWTTQRAVANRALAEADIEPGEVAALGIANQRETTIVWERESGKPIAPAIVWQDRRTAGRCAEIAKQGAEAAVREKTGLLLDPYFSATKIAWLLDHVDGARESAERGELAFGTVDSWLIWNLTGGRVHATDVTNAARTLLFDIQTLNWDEELLRIFNVPRALLPEVRPSVGRFGTARIGEADIAIAGVAGDQPAALLGQNCRGPGQVKNTYGTGAFVVMHTGAERRDGEGLLAGPACRLPGERQSYTLEGSIFVAGALVQWLRDGLGLITRAEEIESLAGQVPDNGGVSIVPALAGLGAPFWDPSARGTILGLTRGTRAAHLARACLEAIALRTRDVIEAMNAAVDAPLGELRVDGGAAQNDLLLQIQADLLGVPIVRPQTSETTTLGAAMLAATSVGAVDADSLGRWWKPEGRFEPALEQGERDRRYREWQRACERSRGWANGSAEC